VRSAGADVHVILNDWESHRITPAVDRLGASWSRAYSRHPISRRERNPLRLAWLAFGVARTSVGLATALLRFRPHRILATDYRSILVNAPTLVAARLLGRRVVFRLPNAPEPGPFYRRLWRYGIAPFVDLFVANSQFTRDELVAVGIPARKVRLVRNAVSVRSGVAGARGGGNGVRIVFAGQVIPEKGLHVLLDAVALLAAAHQADVRLDVVGNMEGWEAPAYSGYREGIRRRASMPDLAGRVEFLGWQDDVPATMADADIHCCPSQAGLRESFGNVALEAKYAGIPSVVTPSGGLPELVRHGVDGFVCDGFTAESVAQGLAFFCSEERRLRAGAAARESLVAFSAERFRDSWVRLLLGDGVPEESAPPNEERCLALAPRHSRADTTDVSAL
jgi:glycosyltransferase involved in cell wall biosynthesis